MTFSYSRRQFLLLGIIVFAFSLLLISPSGLVQATTDGFDGQVLEVWHETDDSVGCLDVKHGNASNGQDVWTWECNHTDAQKWKFEKRTAGDYAGSYRLVSTIGNDTHCLDNRGDFTTGDRMGVWQCVSDTHGAVPNQTVTIAASGDGYTLTFVRKSDSKSVWLVTDRASTNPKGGANQTTVSGKAPDSAVWQIGSAYSPPVKNDPPAQNNPATPEPTADPQPQPIAQALQSDNPQLLQENIPVVQDPIDGRTVHLVHAAGGNLACVEVTHGGPGADVYTTECDKDAANQQFVFEKRTAGHFKGTYQINPKVHHRYDACLDNVSTFAPNFNDWNPLEMHRCEPDEDSNLVRVANQSITITNIEGGYLLSFSHQGRTSWITAARDEGIYGGDVSQITASGTPPASATWRFTTDFEAPDTGFDFDGRVLEIFHHSDAATGCLAMPEVAFDYGTQVRDIQLAVAACDGSAGQKWQFEKQTEDNYLLRTMLYNQVHCIDNDAQFRTSPRMRMEYCAVNHNTASSSEFVDQSITIEAELDGYTLTFTSSEGENSSWLSTNRADDSSTGAVGQTSVAEEVPLSAVWGIGTSIDRAAGRTNRPPPILADPYNGKIFKIKTRHPTKPGYVSGCLHNNRSSRQAGAELSMFSPYMCHWHTTPEYDDIDAGKDWRIEKRSSGTFAGYYRLVNMAGGQARCADADVADTIDNGNEYTNTPERESGLYLDVCVSDSHADVASQSVLITRLPNKGAYGKTTYTITFADGTGTDAKKAYLSATYRTLFAGQRVPTDTVHENSTLYLEEQVVAMTPAPARFIEPVLGQTSSLDGRNVQIFHFAPNANACLQGTRYEGEVATDTCAVQATAGQTWTLQKRTSGRYAGFYQLVNGIGSHCMIYRPDWNSEPLLDNCYADNSASADKSSFAFEPSGQGYIITSVNHRNEHKWLITERVGSNTAASVDLIDKETGIRNTGVWRVRILPEG